MTDKACVVPNFPDISHISADSSENTAMIKIPYILAWVWEWFALMQYSS